MITHTRTVSRLGDYYKSDYYRTGYYYTPLDLEGVNRSNHNDLDMINDIIKESPPLLIPLTVTIFPDYGGDYPCDDRSLYTELPIVGIISSTNSLLDTSGLKDIIVFRLNAGDTALVTGSGHVLLPMGIYEIVNSRICIVKPYIKPTRKTKLPSPRYFERKMRKYN
jgi:hypothetical protein